MPLHTKKITSGTNNLANAPTDTSKNLNAHPTLNDGSLLVLLSSSKFCSTTQHWCIRVSRVGFLGFDFGSHRTTRIDVDVDSVLEHDLILKLNAPRPSSKPHVQLSYDSSLAPRKTPWITHRGYAQYDIDLSSESGGRRVFIVNNFRRVKPLVHHPWTFPHQAERVRIRAHQRELQFQDQARWFMYDHSRNGVLLVRSLA